MKQCPLSNFSVSCLESECAIFNLESQKCAFLDLAINSESISNHLNLINKSSTSLMAIERAVDLISSKNKF